MSSEQTDSSQYLDKLVNLSENIEKNDKTFNPGKDIVEPGSILGRLGGGAPVFKPLPYLSGDLAGMDNASDSGQHKNRANQAPGQDGTRPNPASNPKRPSDHTGNTRGPRSEPYISYGPGYLPSPSKAQSFSQHSQSGSSNIIDHSERLFPKDELLGTIYLGKYELISQLGAGGMGVIYKARQIFLDRIVAIKMLKNNMGSAKARIRFHQEAKAASALNHTGVVGINDFGIDELDRPYMVMEYVEGVTLQEVLRERAILSVFEAYPIFIEMLEALAVAHSRGVIHRDIKPSNVMLAMTADGGVHVKLLDFGIAKVLDVDDNTLQDLTKTGEALGTPLYMSPEQIQTNQVDFRSDLYSFGCFMYVCLTGNPPHMGENKMLTMEKHISEKALSLREASLGLEFPPGLEAIVETLLAKSPADRFQSADETRQALITVARQIGVLPPISPQMAQQGRDFEPYGRACGLVMAQSLSVLVPPPSQGDESNGSGGQPVQGGRVLQRETDFPKTQQITTRYDAMANHQSNIMGETLYDAPDQPLTEPTVIHTIDGAPPFPPLPAHAYPQIPQAPQTAPLSQPGQNQPNKFAQHMQNAEANLNKYGGNDQFATGKSAARDNAADHGYKDDDDADNIQNVALRVRKPAARQQAPVKQDSIKTTMIIVGATAIGVVGMIGFGAFLAVQLMQSKNTPAPAPVVAPASNTLAPVGNTPNPSPGNDQVQEDSNDDDLAISKIKNSGNYPEVAVDKQYYVTDRLMHFIAEAPNTKAHLKTLNISNTRIGDDGLKAIAAMPIQNLICENLSIGREGCKAIARMPRLVNLRIGCNAGVDDAGIAELAKSKTLCAITIGGTSFGVKAIEALKKMPRLTGLGVSYSKLSPDVVAAIAGCDHLVSLKAAGCGLDTDGIRKITGMSKLQSLDLSNNEISKQSLQDLARMPALSNLFLGNCKLPEDLSFYLLKIPNLKLLHFERGSEIRYLSVSRVLKSKKGVETGFEIPSTQGI